MQRRPIRGRAIIVLTALIATMTLAGCSPQEAEIPENTTQEIEVIKTKPKELIVNEINSLLAGKQNTIEKYFGKSDVYTSEAVKDRVSVAKVTFVDIESDIKEKAESSEETRAEETKADTDKKEEVEKKDTVEKKDLDTIEVSGNGSVSVTLHICTMDYDKTRKAVDSLTERMKLENPTMGQEEMNDKVTKEIASRAQNGEFEVHITLPVNITIKERSEAEIEVTEAFKAAITGGWYNPTGATLISGDCPLREAAQAELDKANTENKEAKTSDNQKETGDNQKETGDNQKETQ